MNVLMKIQVKIVLLFWMDYCWKYYSAR